ncbi:MAG: AMP-binding protein [Gammaproteobacteria bacterium]
MSNLYSHFKQKLREQKKNIIVTSHAKYTFTDINDFSAKLVQILLDLGMRQGDRLAAQIEKSEYNIFLYLACLRAGFIYLPLNNTYTHEELDFFFNDAQPKVIICDIKNEKAIINIKSANNSCVKTLDAEGKGSLLETIKTKVSTEASEIYSVDPNETAVILYTSGTTGKPKGAMITHQGLFSNAEDLLKTWGITDADSILHVLPLFHVHGLFFALNTALLSGASTILLPKFHPDQFFKYLPKATVFMGVPTYYTRLINDERLNQDQCKNMRLFISGSAPLLQSTFIEFESKTGHILLERYGMTETGINTSNPLEGSRKVGTVGLSLPSVNIRVVDDKDNAVPLNGIGNIQVKGSNLFKGYWNNPDKTKEEFTEDGYFKTGDLGTLDDDRYLSIVGRSKDLVITGGLNVYPKEIELTIDSIDGVIESAVIGLPHTDFGEAVVAIVSGDENKLDEQLIIEIVKQNHAGYKCPKKVFFIDSLPKNTMGKVQKNILREQFSKLFITT